MFKNSFKEIWQQLYSVVREMFMMKYVLHLLLMCAANGLVSSIMMVIPRINMSLTSYIISIALCIVFWIIQTIFKIKKERIEEAAVRAFNANMTRQFNLIPRYNEVIDWDVEPPAAVRDGPVGNNGRPGVHGERGVFNMDFAQLYPTVHRQQMGRGIRRVDLDGYRITGVHPMYSNSEHINDLIRKKVELHPNIPVSIICDSVNYGRTFDPEMDKIVTSLDNI